MYLIDIRKPSTGTGYTFISWNTSDVIQAKHDILEIMERDPEFTEASLVDTKGTVSGYDLSRIFYRSGAQILCKSYGKWAEEERARLGANA